MKSTRLSLEVLNSRAKLTALTHLRRLQDNHIEAMLGAVQQMARFQDATKFKGGDDFIYRFFGTESARLGLDHKTFLQHCEQAIKTYDGFVKAVEDRTE